MTTENSKVELISDEELSTVSGGRLPGSDDEQILVTLKSLIINGGEEEAAKALHENLLKLNSVDRTVVQQLFKQSFGHTLSQSRYTNLFSRR